MYRKGNKESTRVNAQVKSSSSSKAAIKMAHHQPQITKPVTHNKHKSPVTHKSPLSTTSSTSNPQQTQITNPTSSTKPQNPPNPSNDFHPQNSDQ